ncbi:periplasmic energy transduction protein, TonB-related protein [Syntrophotalea carbinolica DSM 2380]|uniref:Periplasmic energy transduction protein, TonB-related protein n=1 Tax=Syntrophotalea carbinolica (strain DSM 2380 / NBRC 103641 / GraBd1) TaxID=338963 RepID=Q3A1H8_SYNC1|nr:energy transducer TonB [Syntrophotalea carbinolica]ABA89779.1 periplasmic energy transduction protein, TonB-related protein [Syntrophotalea carbinolica DSM 2380]
MSPSSRQDILLAAFAVLSLLLHALLLYLLPADDLLVAPSVKKPVVVEVRPPQQRPREVDMPAQPVTQPRRKPAKRLAPRDQVVPRETAPRGDAPEDRQPLPTVAAPPPAAAPVERKRPGDTGAVSPAPLDLGLPQTTQQRLREGWARKYREDVEEGEAVWLDTEKDLLSSFFKRFRDNIYQVWNYPRAAAERGQSGVCLLRIVINQDGSVDAVEPLESSGYPTLDREAIAAVYRGASYGNLPSSYAKDQLTIMAYFQYRLSGNGVSRNITGR